MALAKKRNFHLPLPEALYEDLRREATRSGKAATEVAREAIEAALDAQRRTRLGEEIARYATTAAGTTDDLDPALERLATDHLLGRRRRRS